MSEDLDPVQLSAQLERVESLLELTCNTLNDQEKLSLLPDSVYEWYEALLERRRAAHKRLQENRESLLASARSKLTPEEWEALKEE